MQLPMKLAIIAIPGSYILCLISFRLEQVFEVTNVTIMSIWKASGAWPYKCFFLCASLCFPELLQQRWWVQSKGSVTERELQLWEIGPLKLAVIILLKEFPHYDMKKMHSGQHLIYFLLKTRRCLNAALGTCWSQARLVQSMFRNHIRWLAYWLVFVI